MALNSKQKQLRGHIIQMVAAAHPEMTALEALQVGSALVDAIVREVQQQAQNPAPGAADLAAMSPDEFEREFADRLAGLGTADGPASPFWS